MNVILKNRLRLIAARDLFDVEADAVVFYTTGAKKRPSSVELRRKVNDIEFTPIRGQIIADFT